jgi:hypothetical protein
MSAKLFPVTQCGHVGGVEVQFHSFLTSALDRDEVNITSRPLYPREVTLIPIEYKGGWTQDRVCKV